MTTHSESFTGTGADVGSDKTWTDVAGDLQKSADKAVIGDSFGTAGVLCESRCEHDTDAPDMFTEATIVARSGTYSDVRLLGRWNRQFIHQLLLLIHLVSFQEYLNFRPLSWLMIPPFTMHFLVLDHPFGSIFWDIHITSLRCLMGILTRNNRASISTSTNGE